MKTADSILLDEWAKPMNGVFTLGDLRALYAETSDAGVYKKLERLIAGGQLVKVKRGIYALPHAELISISARIDPMAYISAGTVLSRHLMIGSNPEKRVQAIKVGVPRKYACALGTIEHWSIAPQLHFGFVVDKGVRLATPEKAWIDVCYYAFKGHVFSFDLDTDVDKSRLNNEKLTEYLAIYDVRFREYFNRHWRP